MDTKKLEQIQQEGGTVMEWKETQIQPLPLDKVEEMIAKIWEKAKNIQHRGQKYIQRLILRDADEELRKFCTYSHKSIFHILTNGKTSEKEVQNLKLMISAKRAIAAGADEQQTINQLRERFYT